jgi:hypothetical protein
VLARPLHARLRAVVRWLASSVPAHLQGHLSLMPLLIALIVSLAGCGSSAGTSATPNAPAPSPTADLACIARARSVDLATRASVTPATFAEALPLYTYDQSAPLCLQLGPKHSAEGGITLQDVSYPSPIAGMITARWYFLPGQDRTPASTSCTGSEMRRPRTGQSSRTTRLPKRALAWPLSSSTPSGQRIPLASRVTMRRWPLNR